MSACSPSSRRLNGTSTSPTWNQTALTDMSTPARYESRPTTASTRAASAPPADIHPAKRPQLRVTASPRRDATAAPTNRVTHTSRGTANMATSTKDTQSTFQQIDGVHVGAAEAAAHRQDQCQPHSGLTGGDADAEQREHLPGHRLGVVDAVSY